jgi:hypothetical protein
LSLKREGENEGRRFKRQGKGLKGMLRKFKRREVN